MIHTQRLALVASLVCLFTSSSSSNAQELIAGQEYYTGNVVIPTNQGGPSSWTGGVYQDNLTCWAWGNPGYCGPNAIVRPGNNINFSFGSSYIYQEQNVANLLPSASGLQIRGYEFQFTAKNGNGWDDGRVDQLTALVRFWDATGGRGTTNLLYGQSYNLNYRFNWTTFNFKETFATPLSPANVGQVQYGFLGRDNNGWAGPYGPEVNNISFALRYSVDPCATNRLSSPSCPGYLDTIASLTPATTTQTVSAPVVQMTTTSPSLPATSDVQPTEVKVDAGGVQVSTTGTISAPDNIPQSVKESQKTEESKPAPNMNLVMSAVRQVQANDRAVQAAAVQNALQEVSNAIANAQEQTNMVIENNQRANDRQQQAIAVAAATSVVNVSNSQAVQRTVEVQQVTQQVQTALPRVDYSLTSTIVSTGSQSSLLNQQRVAGTEVQQQVTSGVNDLINNVLQQRVLLENTNVEQKTETVSNNVQPNELAGNVDIASIATTPAGFNAYLNLALKDGQLYKPDEIYKNQVTIDNARALRQLSSDRLHQQMVDQQYRN